MNRVPQYETYSAIRSAYPNVTEIYNMIVLCKRRRSSKYFERYNYELWTIEPNIWSIIGYTVIIPVVSALGIIGNSLILAVHLKAKTYLKASTYTYLKFTYYFYTVLTTSDLITCVLLVFSSLARGIFRCYKGWLEFDAFVHFPIGSVSSNITVWAALGVSIDRLIIVCYNVCSMQCKSPSFCKQHVARKVMIFATCFAILINIPYCFMYTYNEHGDLVTTNFFHSWWYNLQNWFQFIIFGLIPAVFLLIANAIMLHSVRWALKQREMLLKRKNTREGNRLRDQARLTIMLVGIVFLFLVGELPTHLASRRSAVSLLYGGDPFKVHENIMESFRMWATLLNALASSTNFILYCMLSPNFTVHLKRMLLPEHIVKRKHTRREPIAYFHQQPGDRTRCEIFVL